MRSIKIYNQDNSELAALEARDKGYRVDIYVMKGENYFQLNIYHIVRLQQDFETEFKKLGFYIMEPNIILVSEVATDVIKFTLEKMNERGYFEKIKPVDVAELHLSSLIEI